MSARKAGVWRAAALGLGTVCGCLLALFAALGLTLFREGYYIHRMESSGVLQTMYENVLEGGRAVAAAAGLREDILDELVSYEDVRVAVVRRADEIWHGATDQPDSPYKQTVTWLQDTLSRETGEMWDESDAELYRNIELVCDDMWRTNTAPPLSNLLNLLMQYRRLAWVPLVVLIAALAVCVWLQVRFCHSWRQLYETISQLGFSIFLGAVLGALAVNACGWQGWMPTEDPGYLLYYRWFAALPPALAGCGAALAGVLWVLSLVPFGMMLRRPHKAQKKQVKQKNVEQKHSVEKQGDRI